MRAPTPARLRNDYVSRRTLPEIAEWMDWSLQRTSTVVVAGRSRMFTSGTVAECRLALVAQSRISAARFITEMDYAAV